MALDWGCMGLGFASFAGNRKACRDGRLFLSTY
jgi:hypothetical protein